jgi:hypothetical protein
LVVYWESVVLLGTISSTLANFSLRGAKYIKDRPATMGRTLLVVLYALVMTICAVLGATTELPEGTTA